MKRLIAAGMSVGACVATMAASPALAQTRTVAVYHCLFSGPSGAMAGGANGDPVRDDIDADGRAVLIVHKVQTNFDFTIRSSRKSSPRSQPAGSNWVASSPSKVSRISAFNRPGGNQAANPTSGRGSGFPSR